MAILPLRKFARVIGASFLIACGSPQQEWQCHALTNNTGIINNNTSAGAVECVDLADFFYQIVLALSSFPKATTCSAKQEVEISRFLARKLTEALKNIPGTIDTRNKLCSRPINSRRRLVQGIENPTSTVFDYADFWIDGVLSRTSLLYQSLGTNNGKNRRLLRNFIYVGGGRCRFCWVDNADNRRKLAALGDKKSPTWLAVQRQLLYYPSDDDNPDSYPVVSDSLLCPKHRIVKLAVDTFSNQEAPGWKNAKFVSIPSIGSFLGTYTPGDSFGKVIKTLGHNGNEDHISSNKTRQMHPVVSVSFQFDFGAIDIPNKYANKGLSEHDLPVLFINGIKLDFGTELAKTAQTETHVVNGNKETYRASYAGIHWAIVEKLSQNVAFGPEIDRTYHFGVVVPRIFFDRKHEVDVKFLIKPTAKAKLYGIDNFQVSAITVPCKVVGLKDSPFQEFKALVEFRLRNQLGLDVATEFQNKAGHCLENKIPIVEISLIQKTEWREAKPRCA